jgi:hypothetical protein
MFITISTVRLQPIYKFEPPPLSNYSTPKSNEPIQSTVCLYAETLLASTYTEERLA